MEAASQLIPTKETRTYRSNPGQNRLKEILRQPGATRVLAVSGARSGKTFEFVRSLIARAIHAPDSRHVIIRKHFGQVKKFVWLDTMPKVLRICYPQIEPYLKQDKSDYYWRFPNGAEIWIGGLDDKDRADKILGGEYNTIYFNEVSEISHTSIVTALTRLAMKTFKKDGRPLTNKAYFDCNPPHKTHWSYKMFYDQQDPITNIAIPNPERQAVIELRPEDNLDNLPEQYIEELKNLTGNARLRFYEGLYQDEAAGALWSEKLINKTRVLKAPEKLKRIVVSIDPAVTKTETADETGIVIVGEDHHGHGYVLEDLSGIFSPNEWARRAVAAYNKWEADKIIAEVNQGGDMVRTILKGLQANIAYASVRATRGKILRAEPISSLYEEGIVHHVGSFPDLEYQMVTYTGDKDISPDRLDAAVHGLTFLMTKGDTSWVL